MRTQTNEPLRNPGRFSVLGVAFSPDGSQVATASSDRTARVWNTESGTAPITLTGHISWVLGVAFSPDGSQMATASSDTTAKVWDTAPHGACDLVRLLLTTTELREALGGEPQGCTNLKP